MCAGFLWVHELEYRAAILTVSTCDKMQIITQSVKHSEPEASLLLDPVNSLQGSEVKTTPDIRMRSSLRARSFLPGSSDGSISETA